MQCSLNMLGQAARRCSVGLACAALVVLGGAPAQAGPLALGDAPLFLSLGIKPNLIMAVDDSGSMDFEVLFPGNDGSAWWRTDNASGSCLASSGQSFTGCISDGNTDLPAFGKLNFNNSGGTDATWKKFISLFPNGCNQNNDSYQRRSCDSSDRYAIPPLPDFAWARSAEYNAAYFDPATIYDPWPDGGGLTFSDANPQAARYDPVFGPGTIDLTQDIASNGNVNPATPCTSLGTSFANEYGFRIFAGMSIPAGTCLRVNGQSWTQLASTRIVATAGTPTLNSDQTVQIRYFPATFYLSPAQALPAGYGYTGPTLPGKAPDGSALVGYEVKPANFGSAAQYDAAIQNYANWFSYYRKRHQALRAGLGEAFLGLNQMLVGGFTINNRTTVTMRDMNNIAARTSLYQDFYQNFVRSGGTPNRDAVGHIIDQFRRTDASAPVQYACQQNFGMLFTDGFSVAPTGTDALAGYGNVDGSQGSPYQDGISSTMADATMHAYLNPLRTGASFPPGKVPVPADCAGPSPDPSLDCNDDLHMNFYAVTLGTRGIAFDPDVAQDPYANPPSWPTMFPARHPTAVDDIWHAAINGRGELLNARTPRDISDQLRGVLNDIAERTTSASSASVNSGSISSNTRVYQARFNTGNWTGQLLSFPVNPDGSLAAAEWDASQQMPAAVSRRIISVDAGGNGIPFRWANLSPAQQAALDPAGDGLGAQRVDFLRGDASMELQSGGPFRDRPLKLGDIVASSPVFVGDPQFFYPDSLETAPYSAFRAARTGRTQMIYAGANDGMLHGFEASSGTERLGFVPGAVFGDLHLLSDPFYQHRFYVDGAPNVGDAFFGGAWHTVLVGGLNKGGQGIYALDVTNPAAFTEFNAPNIVLWEFSDADDADLGYSFSQPAIVRMANGRWAAVFGNGYNNTAADGNASASGEAALYVVDLQTGAPIRKISTQTGMAEDPSGQSRPNGLATPAVVDYNNDHVADYVFAGDLFGNLWKFDIRNADPTQWAVAHTVAGAPAAIYQARDGSGNSQPITSRPEVGRGPSGSGMIVLFGTGKYLEPDDKNVALLSTQSFYGVIDRNSGTASDIVTDRTELNEQLISFEFVNDFGGVLVPIRVSTNVPLGIARGWYMDLVSPVNGFEGEMQVSNSILRNGRIVFTTLIPDPDVCGFGGTSWLMELEALSGSRLASTPFDLNNDGQFDPNDFVLVTLPDGTIVSVPVSGRKSEVGIMPTPGVLSGDGVEYKYTPGTTGNIQIMTENPGLGSFGRQSWRQIR